MEPRHSRRQRRSLLLAGSLLAACVAVACARAPQRNSLAVYLEQSEVQYEDDAQRAEICRALSDMLALPPATLSERRYADYTGKAGQWALSTLLARHFVPAVAIPLDTKALYREVAQPETRPMIEKHLTGLGCPRDGTRSSVTGGQR
jgi:hypothetical protein